MRGLNFSFANTRSAIDMIIKSIKKVSKIVFYISQSLFAIWSIFLVIKNINNPLYLVIYAILCICTIAIFIISILFNSETNLPRKLKAIRKKKFKYSKYVIKSIMYLLKLIIIAVSIYELVTTSENLSLKFSTIFMAIILCFQVISDIVLSLVSKYVEMLSIGLQLDTKYLNTHFLSNTLDVIAGKKSKENYFTDDEEKVAQAIEQNRIELKEKQDKERIKNTKKNWAIMFKRKPKVEVIKLTNKEKKEMLLQYENNKKDAIALIESKDQVDKLLKKSQKVANALPKQKEFKDIPVLLKIVKSYVLGDYKEIPTNIISSIVGALMYLVTPFDDTPISIPLDIVKKDSFIFKKCNKIIKNDFNKYIENQDEKLLEMVK